MKPGRELDALVAEKVMGIEPWPDRPGAFRAPVIFPGQVAKPCEPPEYSTHIAAAWQVVEKLKDNVGEFSLQQDQGEWLEWKATFTLFASYEEISAECVTAPLAICLAALKAVEEAGIWTGKLRTGEYAAARADGSSWASPPECKVDVPAKKKP